ncbi:SDR family oxidoreductase [Nocardioides gilvus]|uniref:SDR family oxidoreductase n=1 Tax=Nocardioides gilvus TaxID=1735589 RepID=UPI000D74DA71|nr:SDR family NAD(P)-dependent oxidoreductase [Nocardioides gilvus]
MRDTRPAGRSVLITGAGSGLGAATAVRLSADGHHVHLTGRRADPLVRVAGLITEAGGVATVHLLDVTDPDTGREVVARVVAESGRLDVLVNNAGVFRRGTASQLSVDDWHTTIQTNLTGAFHMAQSAVAAFRAQDRVCGVRGHVLNVNSGAGLSGYAPGAAYSASKFGLMGLSDALRREVGAEGIKVSDIVVAAAVESELSGRSGVRRLPAADVARAIQAVLAMPGDAVLSRVDLTQLDPAPDQTENTRQS